MTAPEPNSVEVEGLLPWLDSGQLPAILRVIAGWYAGQDAETDIRLGIWPWDVRRAYPDLDLAPKLKVEMTYGGRDRAGCGTITIWRGVLPAAVAAALDECLAGCQAAHRERMEHGSTWVARGPQVELTPEDIQP
jgi:hypothetical protein